MSAEITVGEIRTAMGRSSVPMSSGEIIEALGVTDTEDKVKVRSLLGRGCAKGWITRHHSTDGLSYSLNAEHVPKRPGRKRQSSGVCAPAGKTSTARPPEAKPKSEGGVTHQSTSKNSHASPEREVDSRTELGRHPENINSSCNMGTPQRPSDFDLRRRLSAIGGDLADAIADACDAEHPHALIKALVVSREAVARAQQALPV